MVESPQKYRGITTLRLRSTQRGSYSFTEDSMTEAVIVDAIRTPVGALGGVLSSVRPDDLAALVIKEIVKHNQLDPTLIEEVFLGCANQAGEDNRNIARMSALLAGLPVEIGGVTINRLC